MIATLAIALLHMEIIGEGFTLRGWKESDAESLQKHANNTHISDFLLDRFPSPYTLENAVSWITLMRDQNPMLNFVIDIQGSVSGVIGLECREDVYRKTALLGYWISEDYWGKGIMPKAIKLICNYGFEHLDLNRVQAGVMGNNPKSMRVLEKAGFIKEAVMRNCIIKNNVVLDEHIFALLKIS